MTRHAYLLDANVFVAAWKLYYRRSFAPAFWEHLDSLIRRKSAFIIEPVFLEVCNGNDALASYVAEYKALVAKPDQGTLTAYAKVLQTLSDCVERQRYYKNAALRNWSQPNVADPWLIAVAMAKNAIIVTQEVGILRGANQSSGLMGNAKIPDMAWMMGVPSMDMFDFMEQTGFLWRQNG